jgi:hypothetical protein
MSLQIGMPFQRPFEIDGQVKTKEMSETVRLLEEEELPC